MKIHLLYDFLVIDTACQYIPDTTIIPWVLLRYKNTHQSVVFEILDATVIPWIPRYKITHKKPKR